jgi:GNAT superfamily N-acetyltransferase
VAISQSVRRLAFYPFLEVRKPASWQVVERDGVTVLIHDLPIAVIAHPHPGLVDVPAAVAAARDLARDNSRPRLIWMLPPDDVHLRPALEQSGLVHRDAPGFEAIENVMVLEHPPDGTVDAGVTVGRLRSIDDIDAVRQVRNSAFGLPEDTHAVSREAAWQQACDPSNPMVEWLAWIDGRAVGAAGAADAEHGINLFGGAVVEGARGRGVYRALVAKRWAFAAGLGKPALTVQAGRMSRPILERIGFQKIGELLVYDDPDVLTPPIG